MKLRVLLADDEKLVRKSIMTLFPFGAYDMEVVGEAANGQEALQWLGRHTADIIFVDLSMPVMDGFEPLKAISMEYPAMIKIVLTCHAEVKYIQRTIEEGIIGYIIKTDYAMEDIRKLLSRARDLAIRNRDHPFARGLLAGCTRQEYLPGAKAGTEELWLDTRLSLLQAEGKLSALLPPGENGVIVSLTEEQQQQLSIEPEKAQAVMHRQLFYDVKPGMRVYRLRALPPLSEKESQRLQARLLEGEWLIFADAHKTLSEQLASCRYPGDQIMHALHLLLDCLDCILDAPALDEARRIAQNAAIPQWRYTRSLMEEMRSAFTARMREAGLYADSAMVVLRAINMIRDPKKLFGKSDEVAAIVGFSRSHFSRCFSRLMGMRYRDYARDMRLRYVQRKMREENMRIEDVAASLDIVNAAYFCRIYNIHLPNEETGGK